MNSRLFFAWHTRKAQIGWSFAVSDESFRRAWWRFEDFRPLFHSLLDNAFGIAHVGIAHLSTPWDSTAWDGSAQGGFDQVCIKMGDLDSSGIHSWLAMMASGSKARDEEQHVDRKKPGLKRIPEPQKESLWGFRGKTVWDWLDLLIVPAFIALSVAALSLLQASAQQRAEELRTGREQAIEEQRAQNAALQAYLDQMSRLVLEEDLLGSAEGDAVFTLAQARTTTALTQLDGEHNQAATRFLSDSGLLEEPALLVEAGLEGAELPKAVLQDANLAGTKLSGANLAGAVLINADFSATEKVGEDVVGMAADLTKANLSKAALQGADLSQCILDEATLTDAALQSADLSTASLRGADLSYAALQSADLSAPVPPGFPPGSPPPITTNLTDADLSHAALTDAALTDAALTDADLTDAVLRDTTLSGALLGGADLSGADLTNATVTQEQLDKAASLKGATMPDGQKYEEWLKSKGSGEDGENTGPS
jgi:uncharacterized protein YjbI with pentapeptide repeats